MTALFQKPPRQIDRSPITHEQKQQQELIPSKGLFIFEKHGVTDRNRRFVIKCLKGVPFRLRGHFLKGYVKRYNSETAKNPQRSANIFIRNATRDLKARIKHSAFSKAGVGAVLGDNTLIKSEARKALFNDDALEREALRASMQCQTILRNYANSESAGTYERRICELHRLLCDFARVWEVTPPFHAAKMTIEQKESAICRLIDDAWWLSRLFKKRDQFLEFLAVSLRVVHRDNEIYASNEQVSKWRQQQTANEQFMQAMELINKHDDTAKPISLAELFEKSSASPEKRRIELMMRCRGLEDLAQDYGWQSTFVTWTAPSKYHANSKRYNGATPSEVQKYLCNQWAKARAKIKRKEVEWFGVRVSEPHHDACPHWHLLIYTRPESLALVESILSDYALQHDANEEGADESRITFKRMIDGKATGYIAKYISKNVNAERVNEEVDLESGKEKDLSLGDTVNRVTAWASLWRIRQFQFFGAAPVSVWRECRRLKDGHDNDAFEAIRSAADESKWDEFSKLIKANPLKLNYEVVKNRFDEEVKRIDGLDFDGDHIVTREARYALQRKGSCSSEGDSSSRSPVSNCTGDSDSSKSTVPPLRLDPYLIPILNSGFSVLDGEVKWQVKEGRYIQQRI